VTQEPRRARGPVLLLLSALGVALVPASSTESVRRPILGDQASEPLSASDRRALLEAHAPVVLLAPDERALPAHAEWFFARARLLPGKRLQPTEAALGGSADPADWTTYGHVYRAAGGGLHLQYWFFYPYNRFHRVGNHEGDWEHVTVHLGADGRPRGAWYARHEANAPGVWFPWSALVREGPHPVVLAAAGSHASYASVREVPWYESVCPTTLPEDAARRGCRVWRTWGAGAGGIVDLGTRDAPEVEYLLWPGRWGAKGGIADDGAGPPGPAFQPGWCSRGTDECS
jgi:hypothetical protein